MLRASRICSAVLAALPFWGLEAAQAECRQALALGLDVSGSVDAREYRLQLEGLAAAFDTPSVRRALFSLPSAPIEVLVYEWSGSGDQHILQNWRTLETPDDISELQSLLRQTERRETSPGTALGQAMRAGLSYLSAKSNCWKRTLDISGDGKSNLGPEPKFVKDDFAQAGVTLNALVIGADSPGFGDLRQEEIAELSSYFRTQVISGAESFVQTALGYEEYATTMALKLERELESFALSDAGDLHAPRAESAFIAAPQIARLTKP